MPSPDERDALMRIVLDAPSSPDAKEAERVLWARIGKLVAEVKAKEHAEWLEEFLSKPGDGPWRVTRLGQLPYLVSRDERSISWSEDEREAIAICAALNALAANP